MLCERTSLVVASESSLADLAPALRGRCSRCHGLPAGSARLLGRRPTELIPAPPSSSTMEAVRKAVMVGCARMIHALGPLNLSVARSSGRPSPHLYYFGRRLPPPPSLKSASQHERQTHADRLPELAARDHAGDTAST